MIDLVKITNWVKKNVLKNFDTNTNTKLANGTVVNPAYCAHALIGNAESNRVSIKHTNAGELISPKIIIDGIEFPVVTSSTAGRIVSIEIDYSSYPWKLKIVIYIDGNQYTKYITLE